MTMVLDKPVGQRETPARDTSDVFRRGEEIYAQVRAAYEPQFVGDYLIIETSDGTVERVARETPGLLAKRLHEKGASTTRYLVRIGYQAFAVKGGRLSRRDGYGWKYQNGL